MDGAVIVTGGSRRIGRKISQSLSSAGFPIIIHYNSSSSEAEELASELRSRGGMAETLMCDLSSTSDLEDMIERADAIFNVGIVGLVNNASMYSYDDVDSIDHRSFSSHMSVNAYAPLTLSTQMHKRGRGWVVNILDFKVESPNSDFLSYTISKFALASVTDILARELAPVLRVNAVAPGHTLTSDYLDEGKLESTNSSTPLGVDEFVDSSFPSSR